MTYRYRTNRPLPGFERVDRQKLAKDGITALSADDGMRFQVEIDIASPEAAAEYLTAKLELRGIRDEELTADDIRPAA